MVVPDVARVRWREAHRIIRSIYPPVHLFEDIADPADWELIASAEAKTNPRVRDQIGAIHLVPVARRVTGAGATWVMAPFCHFSPDRPTRFSDGTYGVYYAGDRFRVALLETVFHFERFMRATDEDLAVSDFRQLIGSVDANFHDLRGDDRFMEALDPDDYSAGQSLGRNLRNNHGSDGIVYQSVRCPEGEAIGAFWPDLIEIPMQAQHLCYRWNGQRADAYMIYGEDDWYELP